MGQATVDLPDPLQNAEPAAAKNADDLLAQMAGDEIDRLLAETDSDAAPAAAASATAVAPVCPTESTSATAAPIDLDAVLETAAADRSAEERIALQVQTKPAAPVDSSPKIDLGIPSRRLPLIFRPLEWLSAPLDPWPDQFREILGKVGLMTLINALAVLAYVLIFRHHHR